MAPEVDTAIKDIAAAFPESRLDVIEDGQGGAFVRLHDFPLVDRYQQASTWIGFQITHTYPYADVYPHFVRHDLSRRDGNPLGEGTATGSFRNEPAIQVSRRANRHNPSTIQRFSSS